MRYNEYWLRSRKEIIKSLKKMEKQKKKIDNTSGKKLMKDLIKKGLYP